MTGRGTCIRRRRLRRRRRRLRRPTRASRSTRGIIARHAQRGSRGVRDPRLGVQRSSGGRPGFRCASARNALGPASGVQPERDGSNAERDRVSSRSERRRRKGGGRVELVAAHRRGRRRSIGAPGRPPTVQPGNLASHSRRTALHPLPVHDEPGGGARNDFDGLLNSACNGVRRETSAINHQHITSPH